MRHLLSLFILSFSLNTISLFGQEKLRIEYEVLPFYESEEKNQFEINTISSLFELISDKNESLYTVIPKVYNEQSENFNEISATMSADVSPIYKDTDNNLYIEEIIVGNKQFLVQDVLPEINWIITKETKEIAGFTVLKAVANIYGEHNTIVEAWYCPKLSYKTGPSKFWGLPGIILELKTEVNYENNSREGTKYLATKVSVLKSDEKIKMLNKGKKITRKEFDAFQAKFLKDQMEMFNSGVDKN